MNERIRELMAQATKVVEPNDPDYRHEIFDKEKFAELIILECAEVAGKTRWAVPPTQEQIASSIRQLFGVEE